MARPPAKAAPSPTTPHAVALAHAMIADTRRAFAVAGKAHAEALSSGDPMAVVATDAELRAALRRYVAAHETFARVAAPALGLEHTESKHDA